MGRTATTALGWSSSSTLVPPTTAPILRPTRPDHALDPMVGPSNRGLPCALTDRLPPALVAELFDCLNECGVSTADLEEIRLRAGRYTALTVAGENIMTHLLLDSHDLSDILTALCGGSLYAYSQDIAEGFLTLPEGIRVGVAGRASLEDRQILGLREVTGLCIRLPHHGRATGRQLAQMLRDSLATGSARGILIYGPPGVGKTTLLRSLAVELSSPPAPLRTVLVDTRAELCYDTTDPCLSLDVLVGYPRARGVEIATRTLSAQVILCDEIGDCTEAMSLTEAHRGGVPLVASAHAADRSELLHRTGLRLLHEAQLFSGYVGLARDGRGGFRYTITPWEIADREL